MKLFVQSYHCESHVHCQVCRALNGGRLFRKMMGDHFELPASAPDFECPHGKSWIEDQPAPARSAPPTLTEEQIAQAAAQQVQAFRSLWAELHQATDATPQWLADFSMRIPCGDCREHWAAIMQELPPRYGDDWFAWTVAAHNAVNRRISKGEITMDEANQVWKRDGSIVR